MGGLCGADLLRVWERGAGQHPVDRALTLLALSAPEGTDRSLVADLPIGERDERLLALRARLFGPRLVATTSCVRCGERVELEFLTSDVSRPAAAAAPGAAIPDTPAVRPLTSRDLAAAADCVGVEQAREMLAARCLVGVVNDIERSVVARALEQADPGALRVLEVRCPGCGHAWECDFDVAAYFWIEIEAAALRLLRDVHVLARGYGWSEQDILAMSPQRRRAYLELVS